MDSQKAIRKNKDLIMSSGYALVIIALWFLAKAILCFTAVPDFANQLNDILNQAKIISGNFTTEANFGLLSSLLFLLVFQIFVGILAKREGKREQVKGTLCVVFAFVLLVLQLPSLVYDIYLLIYAFNSLFIVSTILDVICILSIISIIYAILKNKALNKKEVKQ